MPDWPSACLVLVEEDFTFMLSTKGINSSHQKKPALSWLQFNTLFVSRVKCAEHCISPNIDHNQFFLFKS